MSCLVWWLPGSFVASSGVKLVGNEQLPAGLLSRRPQASFKGTGPAIIKNSKKLREAPRGPLAVTWLRPTSSYVYVCRNARGTERPWTTDDHHQRVCLMPACHIEPVAHQGHSPCESLFFCNYAFELLIRARALLPCPYGGLVLAFLLQPVSLLLGLVHRILVVLSRRIHCQRVGHNRVQKASHAPVYKMRGSDPVFKKLSVHAVSAR